MKVFCIAESRNGITNFEQVQSTTWDFSRQPSVDTWIAVTDKCSDALQFMSHTLT